MDIHGLSSIPWYHTIELSKTYVTLGEYDWRPYMDNVYRIMGPLSGKSVLDVGTGNGFFAFEFEKQGARVTAVDIPDQSYRDNNLIGVGNIQRGKEYANAVDFRKPFYIAKEALSSSVERLEMNLYDMTPANMGTFDIIFCNDVLLHLTDPFRALWIFHNLCKAKMVVGLPILAVEKPLFSFYKIGKSLNNAIKYLALSINKHQPMAEFHGGMLKGEFWIPSLECLRQWVEGTGFTDIQHCVVTLKKEHNANSLDQQTRGFVSGAVHSAKP